VNGQIICTAFGNGRTHDYSLFKTSETRMNPNILGVFDSAYTAIARLHRNSLVPIKRSKKRPLTPQDKSYNRVVAMLRVANEHAFRRIKVFRVISGRNRHTRKRFPLRFNLISAIANRLAGF
jgi:hypothetical protein